jgi:uncharacterized membrane protein (DUF485 family)
MNMRQEIVPALYMILLCILFYSNFFITHESRWMQVYIIHDLVAWGTYIAFTDATGKAWKEWSGGSAWAG